MRTNRLLLTALLGLGACGPSIRVSRTSPTPIPAGTTWTWGASDAGRTFPEHHPMVDNATVRGRIEEAIAAELTTKGFRQVTDSAQAKLLIHFHVGVEERHDTLGPRPTCNGKEPCVQDWGFWGSPEAMPREIDYDAGQLMIDVVDAATRRVIWRGVLEQDVVKRDLEPAAIRAAVRKLVRKM